METDDHGRLARIGVFFPVLGLFEGAVWWLADPFAVEPLGAARVEYTVVALITAAFLVGRLTWTGRAPSRWAAVMLALGGVVGLVTWLVWGHIPSAETEFRGDGQRALAWAVGAFAFLYILTPFAQIHQQHGRLRFPYEDLFDHSWNNFFIGLVATGFTGALWVVLGVWGALFNLVEISVFSDLFGSRPFAYFCTFTVFGYGLALGRSSEAVIAALRRITLLAGRALLPLTATVALLFALTLPATGLGPLWATGSATPLVLVLLALLALLLNAVFEDGSRAAPYPTALRVVVEAAICVMPLYAAIAIYGTSLRVSQYGLTPQRVYALIFGTIALVYSVGYAAAVVRREGPWIGLLRRVNVAAALLVATITLLVQLWPLDPLRLSAKSQAGRLARGEVAASDFDFATLRFRLGHYGWAELDRLEALEQHPQVDAIRVAIETVRSAPNFWSVRSDSPVADLDRIRFQAVPRGLKVPPAVLEAMARDRTDLGRTLCSERGACLVLGADVDGDDALEFCLLGGVGWFYSACYRRSGPEEWKGIGTLAFRGESSPPSTARIEEWYGGMTEVPIRPSVYHDLVVPGGVLQIVPRGFSARAFD